LLKESAKLYNSDTNKARHMKPHAFFILHIFFRYFSYWLLWRSWPNIRISRTNDNWASIRIQ